jgi:hypothetical protein
LLSGVIYAQTINEPMTADRSIWGGSDYTWTLANENLATKFWASSPIGTLNQKDNGI